MIVKEWGRKIKESLDPLLCIGWSWRTLGPTEGTRRPTQQASNPCSGGRDGAENGSGLPILGNNVYGKHFSLMLRNYTLKGSKFYRSFRPRREANKI